MAENRQLPQPWIRAFLPLAILGCLTSGPAHGYAIAQELGARGFGVPRGGSLYPVLGKLEADGLVATTWVEGQSGPGRKEYALTVEGHKELEHASTQFTRLGEAVFTHEQTKGNTHE